MWRNSFRTLEAVGIFAICGALFSLHMPLIYFMCVLHWQCENVTIHTGLTLAVIVLCTYKRFVVVIVLIKVHSLWNITATSFSMFMVFSQKAKQKQ